MTLVRSVGNGDVSQGYLRIVEYIGILRLQRSSKFLPCLLNLFLCVLDPTLSVPFVPFELVNFALQIFRIGILIDKIRTICWFTILETNKCLTLFPLGDHLLELVSSGLFHLIAITLTLLATFLKLTAKPVRRDARFREQGLL